MSSECRTAMSVVDGATIEPRTRINRPPDESARCRVSRAPGPRKNFSQSPQQPTTSSMSNGTALLQNLTEPSGHRHCKCGVKLSSRPEPKCRQTYYVLNFAT